MKVIINKLECKRCGHRWIPRHLDVRSCPHCRTTLWDVEKKVKENLKLVKKYRKTLSCQDIADITR